MQRSKEENEEEKQQQQQQQQQEADKIELKSQLGWAQLDDEIAPCRAEDGTRRVRAAMATHELAACCGWRVGHGDRREKALVGARWVKMVSEGEKRKKKKKKKKTKNEQKIK